MEKLGHLVVLGGHANSRCGRISKYPPFQWFVRGHACPYQRSKLNRATEIYDLSCLHTARCGSGADKRSQLPHEAKGSDYLSVGARLFGLIVSITSVPEPSHVPYQPV